MLNQVSWALLFGSKQGCLFVQILCCWERSWEKYKDQFTHLLSGLHGAQRQQNHKHLLHSTQQPSRNAHP